MSIRVVVADDHALLRSGLRLVLDAEPGVEVVGEAQDAPGAVRAIEETRPDVALVDLAMPGGGGLAVLQGLKDARSSTRALVITMYDTVPYLRAALEAGAAGYVTKKVSAEDLVAAVRTVARGGAWVDLAVEANEPLPVAPLAPRRVDDHLSGREREVLELLAQGFTNREIGERLGVSVKTVEGYRARLLDKLGMRTRAELVRYAMETGVLGARRE